ncbi:hypothetical protein [Clostridium sp. ZS2-4]|nr:hypothetical protein [Clostridium sp. ZS2-4]MCY6354477.1 hypothetical protein [Clostridium sp. ZS2-4]
MNSTFVILPFIIWILFAGIGIIHFVALYGNVMMESGKCFLIKEH